jgi:hypothetical protein
MATAVEAEGRLPFPDPQLSFAEMAELAQCDCAAGRRLADLLGAVINQPLPAKKRARKSGTSTTRGPKAKKSAAKPPRQ